MSPNQHLVEMIRPMIPSSSSSVILALRGGSSSISNQVETLDSIYTQSAVGYFNNLRVPAAVFMSIIMKEMFALQSSPSPSMRKWDVEHGVDHSRRWRILRYSYLLLMVLAFSLETFTIFVATQVLTQLATAQRMVPLVPVETNVSSLIESEKSGGFFGIGKKEIPQSMVDFLIANFEFEYATCRFHFVTGILSFTVATALRVRYALRKYRQVDFDLKLILLSELHFGVLKIGLLPPSTPVSIVIYQ